MRYRTLEAEGSVYVRRGLGTFVSSRPKESPARQSVLARQIAERMLRDGYRHGLLASDLIAALREIAPKVGKEPEGSQVRTRRKRYEAIPTTMMLGAQPPGAAAAARPYRSRRTR